MTEGKKDIAVMAGGCVGAVLAAAVGGSLLVAFIYGVVRAVRLALR